MEEKENAVKFTISMEKELRDWVDGKVKEMNRKDRRFKTSRSALIADAVQILKDSEEQGKAASPEPVGVKMATLSESLGSGPLTATKKPSRRAG
jgi:metal-responsive CopG/Arc/MetJ family transcriptional regulator